NNKCSDANAACISGPGSDYLCQKCGGVGELCCPSSGATQCKDATSVCAYGNDGYSRCQTCGVAGGPCCTGQTCNDATLVCADSGSNQRCLKCGTASTAGSTTPCCAG